MSRVTLLAINSKYVHSSLAIWFLAGGISQYACLRHDVEIIETTIHQHEDIIIEKIVANLPEVIGISTYIWNSGKLLPLIDKLRERLPNAIVIMGGPEASHNAEHWTENGADYVLQGEGERSLPVLLDSLENKDMVALESISGLCWNKSGEFVCNPVEGLEDGVVDPYSKDYFKTLDGRIAYIETSRGCPFRCSFCLSGKSNLRFFPLDAAKRQLLELSQSGAKTVKLVDRTFNCNKSRAYELFEYVIGLNTACHFHFEVAADLFDKKTLALLNTAPPGRIQLEAGVQSFYEPTLEAVSRKTDVKKIEENIKALLAGENIHIHIDLIAGLPLETLQSFIKSFNRAYALGAHTLQLGFLKLLPGSVMREQAEQLGIIYNEKPPYEIISSPWIGKDDLGVLKQAENALQHTYNKGRFLQTLQYVLFATGVNPFEMYRDIGRAVPNHGEYLNIYADKIYNYCVSLTGVEEDKLHDFMTCDWLSTVKGKNLPHFLRETSGRRKDIAAMAENLLGRKIERGEAAALLSGEQGGVFVDSREIDIVTGLYKLYYIDR